MRAPTSIKKKFLPALTYMLRSRCQYGHDLPGMATVVEDLRFHGDWVFGYVNVWHAASGYYAFHSVCHIGRLCNVLSELVWR